MCGDNQIRLALEKMQEANIKKLFVKIHNDDQSTKNILIDETMSISNILILLFHKYHLKPTFNYSIIEDLPDLHIYRIFEDHQNLINHGLIHWSRDTSNRICFREHLNKYLIFQEPTRFFSTPENTSSDYISSDAIILPDNITSVLYIKDKNRKIWKKSTCVLRQSGIYQIPKSSSFKRDLICLLKFDSNMQLYYANNWIESLRSPTSFGFALKSAHIQKKSNKYIHYLCTNTFEEYQRWINGIRIIFYGLQLYKNYQEMNKIVEDGFENLVHLLPSQHHFNFITSTTSAMQHSISSISLPINQIVSDTNDSQTSLIDIDSMPMKCGTYSLGRLDEYAIEND
jgi:amyloid beta A4 precursor protein-binding family B protein 1-interacting protein